MYSPTGPILVLIELTFGRNMPVSYCASRHTKVCVESVDQISILLLYQTQYYHHFGYLTWHISLESRFLDGDNFKCVDILDDLKSGQNLKHSLICTYYNSLLILCL